MADRPPPPLPGSMPSSFDSDPDFHKERRMNKFVRKLKEEPLIPLGLGLTVFAFVNAYRAIRRGDSHQANRFFRLRVAAQGFTVLAVVGGGVFYSNDREKVKELRQLEAQRAAEEKRQKWLRELEARDEEEKALIASMAQKKLPQNSSEEQPSGGLLRKMGLWPQGDGSKAAVNEDTSASETRPKKENPKSSLGVIGEVMAAKKREQSESKTEGGKKDP
ncbi:hypothetical protein L249_7813 [Ophiocordyceps polyrhachis-furcata BCC 54312]|uniref:HIG1 domain-containing protein n=1 Tax=Ophiocordyceps polyrhachis-furcata BCC 54312 TaxID=1330021 RepID=A0A367L0P0_9HYPO|nr:hypothetical protein L249_7813 [Ophiocordyceps polyrhachis-furcata BCC 54312]